MATAAQTLANRANSQRSTGPRTDAGKAAVSHNATSHGLSSAAFTLLPHENPEDFENLLTALEEEFNPQFATESFLILEMARAQWKLARIENIEARILTGAAAPGIDDPWAAIAQHFATQTGDALLKLDRYATAARRSWHKSLDALQKLRVAEQLAGERESRIDRNCTQAEINRILSAPVPIPPPSQAAAAAAPCKTKPMPAHLQRELAAHKRRDPLFDPRMDASQMSRELRRWFEQAA